MAAAETKYMRRALKLARRGIGEVEPNPAVGAVIVKANQIIGEGWHERFGGPHAEITAIEDCQSLGADPAGGTMYVTLEPCRHEGKTGPCTDAIIEAGISKVVVATVDPSEHAGGKGIEQLRQAGIEAEVGLCEHEARLLNAPFFKFAATGKTWVILKWAQSIDGKLAYVPEANKRWVSSDKSRKDAHKLRRRAGAILVGVNTVLADNPLLTPRPAKDSKPMRVVLDSDLRTPVDCQLLATANESPVLIVGRQETLEQRCEAAEQIRAAGAEVVGYPDMQGQSNLDFVLAELGRRGVQQVLVEGGPAVISSFLSEALADEICVYISPKILAGQGTADIAGSIAEIADAVELGNVNIERFGDDVRLSGFSAKALAGI